VQTPPGSCWPPPAAQATAGQTPHLKSMTTKQRSRAGSGSTAVQHNTHYGLSVAHLKHAGRHLLFRRQPVKLGPWTRHSKHSSAAQRIKGLIGC
jgi:hypothetical protein